MANHSFVRTINTEKTFNGIFVPNSHSASKTPEIQESNLRDMANVGAEIVDSADFIRAAGPA